MVSDWTHHNFETIIFPPQKWFCPELFNYTATDQIIDCPKLTILQVTAKLKLHMAGIGSVPYSID